MFYKINISTQAKKEFKIFKEYVFSIRFFILAAFLLFVFSALNGYFSAQKEILEIDVIMEMLQEKFAPIIEMDLLSQFLFILLNNSFIAFLAIIFGLIFGIFPFFLLISNGALFGLVAYFAQESLSWTVFVLGILPHGIIEIPAIILSCAIGMKMGKVVFVRIFARKGSIKDELNIALGFFLKFLFPFLILASAIEVFITARFLQFL